MAPPRALTDLDDDALQALVVRLGGKPFQARQVAHWLYRHGTADYDGMRNVPAALRRALAEELPARGSSLAQAELAQDGTEKLLLRLADGQTVECVLIPDGARTTLCVSSQVGCPVGCVFCASGMFGVSRNLSAGEIVEQVLQAKARLPADRAITNLVVMGMGEPMLNLDALLPALRRLHDPAGLDMGARRITVSTSGYPRQMAEFAAADPSWNLAVSLHAADDELRRRLVPTAQHPVREIVRAAASFFAQKGREVTFEVVLLADVNDRPQDAAALVRELGAVPCTVNLIPWNPVDELVREHDLRRPAAAAVDAFAADLRRGGLKVTVRRQRGADRSAACGQLRVRELQARRAGDGADAP
ncbi:MAG: 23S rRNA (adenine(2503)-C(2))-methyltransferase RlmN [Planctomycetota bacterium]